MFRVGLGHDTHLLQEGRDLYLGGILIPYKKGLVGHSDADVLLHAICDSLLGAMGLGDIGSHFPDHDDAFKDISSSLLLTEVMNFVKEGHYEVVNIDATLLCEQPKLAPYRKAMETRIAALTQARQVNIKATTTEGMNDEGRGHCISAQAICLIQKLTEN
ncbi:2-C-methyl-D-erythritol 2,4-cyclodiphosphate synthase [Spirochaetota bacterium]|nr:2-C-methyl-D-erythritol 2,4-cyclodiphosphate synthase [Spirochaetota bacterium]